jgi:hypothetical protein
LLVLSYVPLYMFYWLLNMVVNYHQHSLNQWNKYGN